MAHTPDTVLADARLTEAEKMMKENEIHALLFVGADGKYADIVEIYDLWRGINGFLNTFYRVKTGIKFW